MVSTVNAGPRATLVHAPQAHPDAPARCFVLRAVPAEDGGDSAAALERCEALEMVLGQAAMSRVFRHLASHTEHRAGFAYHACCDLLGRMATRGADRGAVGEDDAAAVAQAVRRVTASDLLIRLAGEVDAPGSAFDVRRAVLGGGSARPPLLTRPYNPRPASTTRSTPP